MRNIFIISVDDESKKLLVRCRWNRTMEYTQEWFTHKNVWAIVQSLAAIISNFTVRRYAKERDPDAP